MTFHFGTSSLFKYFASHLLNEKSFFIHLQLVFHQSVIRPLLGQQFFVRALFRLMTTGRQPLHRGGGEVLAIVPANDAEASRTAIGTVMLFVEVVFGHGE